MTKNKWIGHNDFELNDQVVVQDLKKMKWSLQGYILEPVRSQDLYSRSFPVKLQDKRIVWRSN